MKILKWIVIILILILSGFSIMVLSTSTLRSQVTEIVGLAIAQSEIRWNKLKDAAVGDDQISGVGAFAPYLFDGVNFDRVRGDTTNGIWVNVKASTSIGPIPSGTAFYAIKRTDVAAVSINLAFGFTSKKVIIETDTSNTDAIVIDWLGGVAVAPAANTAGDDLMAPGRIVVLDDYAVTSISVIAVSGTQTVYVRAFN